jgi:uncharacterized protein YlxW (UPF0749 family)
MMTKEEARAYKESWRLVNEITNEEARRTSVSERIRGLEQLYEFAKQIGSKKQEGEQEKVWARWNRLREIAGV